MPTAQTIYAHVVKEQVTQIHGYNFHPAGNSFIQFNNPGADFSKVTGWKFHLSVNAEDVTRATDIVMDVYRKYDGMAFKVTNPETLNKFSDPALSGQQAGKIFTLYDFGEENWPQMMHEIEQRFHEAAIKPGQPVVEDDPIAGSHYAFRRNDRNPNAIREKDSYVSAKQAREINPDNPANPFNQHDPLKDLDLSSARQPQPAHLAVSEEAPTTPHTTAETRGATSGHAQQPTSSSTPNSKAGVKNPTEIIYSSLDSNTLPPPEGRLTITEAEIVRSQLHPTELKPPSVGPAVTGAMEKMTGRVSEATLVVSLLDGILKKDPIKIATTAGGVIVMEGAMKVVAAKAGARAVPIVGEVIGAGFAVTDAIQSANSHNTRRAWLSGVEASLYTTAAVTGAAAAFNFWNPAGWGAAIIAGVTVAAAGCITAAKAISDAGWLGHFADSPSALAASNIPEGLKAQIKKAAEDHNQNNQDWTMMKKAMVALGQVPLDKNGNVDEQKAAAIIKGNSIPGQGYEKIINETAAFQHIYNQAMKNQPGFHKLNESGIADPATREAIDRTFRSRQTAAQTNVAPPPPQQPVQPPEPIKGHNESPSPPKTAAPPNEPHVAKRPNYGAIASFRTDSATLSAQDKADIAQAAKDYEDAARQGKANAIEITGYTDKSGPQSYNQALSEKRAHAVEEELKKDLAKDGIKPDQVSINVKGVGSSNATPNNNGHNKQERRVTLSFASP